MCPSCQAAEKRPTMAEFTAGCTSCIARALAATGAHLESAKAGAMTEQYRGALERLFGDAWKTGHAEVKRWGSLIHRAGRAV